MSPRFPRALSLSLCFALASAPPAAAQLAKIETSDIRVVYVDPTETFLAPFAARTFLNSFAFHRKLFDFKPAERPTVLLVDFSDYGNASAGSVPRNTVQVQIAPMSYLFETLSAGERLTMLANHELVHVATMDQATGADTVFRKLFAGKVNPVAEQPESVLYFYLTSPRVAVPRWYLEGIAVFVETWMSGGLGRAQSGYDEMVFRAMVRDDSRFYDPLGLVSEGTKIDFQVEANSYLYGARFMTWLAYAHSPEKLIEWVTRRPGSRAYFAAQFRHVFGKSLEQAWGEWIAFERDFQQKNLDAVRKYPITPTTDLSPRALGSISRAYYDAASGRIYAALNYPGQVAHVGAISTSGGAVDHLVDIKGPKIYQVASLAADVPGNALYYTTDNGAHRDLVKLDLTTRRTTVLQKDIRIGDLAMNRADGSIWGVRHLLGIASIARMQPPYTDWTRVVSLPYGTLIYDVDVSPDGTMLVGSFGEVSGRQSVRVWRTASLLAGDLTPINEFDFGGLTVPNSFVFSPDGRYLYGTSYFTGVSNIFRYELATKSLEPVTNAETGFFRPMPIGGDELIAFRYTGEGLVPVRLTAQVQKDLGSITFLGERTVAKHPVLQSWQIPSPQTLDYDALPKTQGTYHLSGGMLLESLYPIVQGYKDTAAIGARVDFSDPLRLNHASISVSFSPDRDLPARERVHIGAEYRRYDWEARATWNNADFYDLFGPTKTSRKGYAVSVARTETLIFDEPKRLTARIEGRLAGNLDQLPEYQNVLVAVDRLFSVRADLNYSFVKSSLGHVDDEKGRKAGLSVHTDRVNGEFFTRVHGTYDTGAALPIGHSSIWIRSAAGFSPHDPGEPFANFFFGGFGNNYVDHAEEKRYREYYSFPGTELNAIGGRNFVRSLVEWNLPPVRFSRAGTPGAYLSWMRPAVFVGGLLTNLDQEPIRRRALTAGGQLDFRFTILSALDMTLSAGAAIAVEPGSPARREAMVSMRVLR
ncbi:MAG TPA: hypothetical protein VES67_23260 [Vicinamibacterales bacterium]|nr:hypothetical protein [Vicinamibacterales bacterium]